MWPLSRLVKEFDVMTRSCACALLAVVFVVPSSFAQTPEDLLEDVLALRN